VVYENGYKSWGLVVYSVLSKREELDNMLIELEISGMEDVKYISFKHTSSNNKVGSLHLSNITNVKARFETLYNTNILEQAFFEEKIGSL